MLCGLTEYTQKTFGGVVIFGSIGFRAQSYFFFAVSVVCLFVLQSFFLLQALNMEMRRSRFKELEQGKKKLKCVGDSALMARMASSDLPR